ncbi:MAG: hypothetical protein KatS3mg068_1234 [Candidatus Sericytochromatia bacterium]|nr:MAG: hypothetical protein KatS3mg068_1234 [Candidatus Sericytochromatia bacterium]
MSISIDKNNNNFAVAFVSDNKVNLQKYYSDMKKKGNEIIFSSINNSYQTNLSLSNHTGILTWLDGTSPSQGVINFKMFNMIDNNIINYAIDYNNMLSHPFVVLNGKKRNNNMDRFSFFCIKWRHLL